MSTGLGTKTVKVSLVGEVRMLLGDCLSLLVRIDGIALWRLCFTNLRFNSRKNLRRVNRRLADRAQAEDEDKQKGEEFQHIRSSLSRE